MMHTIHAKDVEAEILPEEVLAEPLPGRPHLEGHGPGRVDGHRVAAGASPRSPAVHAALPGRLPR